MATFTITLESFEFPEKLGNDKANFRFIVDVRYVDRGGDFATEHAVMPSLDTFWECDTRKKDNPNFVRAANHSRFNMDRIDNWDRLAIRLKGITLESVQVKVIDVDRKDVFDKLKGALQGVLESALGALRTRIASRIPSAVGDQIPSTARQSLGSAADDVETLVLKKLAGGDDVLFRGSSVPEHNSVTIKGNGTAGIYTIAFNVREETDS